MKFSLITPTHKREKELARAILSVFSQDHREWEMIIINDSPEVPYSFLSEIQDTRIRSFDYNDEQKIIGVKLPIKVILEVKEAPPAIKGNTAAGGGKMVILETGAQLTVPLFIEAGERVVVNTDTNEYVERYNEKDAK